MNVTLFLGCNIPVRVKQYELSVRAIMGRLGIELNDLRESNCCGYPLRNSDFEAFLLSSAKNLALAEKKGQTMMVLCKCCYGSLKKADHIMKNDPSIKSRINAQLAKEGLEYHGKLSIKHLLTVLHQDIGLSEIEKKITKILKGLNIATHYGCHALRPSDITEFDDPRAPIIFDELVQITGATSINWKSKLDCCGAPIFGINDDLAMDLTEKKLTSGKEAGADYLCVACPYCQLQFDTVQDIMIRKRPQVKQLSSILYPQLLGLAMGIDPDDLGFKMNKLDITGLANFLV